MPALRGNEFRLTTHHGKKTQVMLTVTLIAVPLQQKKCCSKTTNRENDAEICAAWGLVFEITIAEFHMQLLKKKPPKYSQHE